MKIKISIDKDLIIKEIGDACGLFDKSEIIDTSLLKYIHEEKLHDFAIFCHTLATNYNKIKTLNTILTFTSNNSSSLSLSYKENMFVGYLSISNTNIERIKHKKLAKYNINWNTNKVKSIVYKESLT